MCGIAGFSGLFDRSLLDGMSETIAHRGPDDAGSVMLESSDVRVGLAHRRLSIIDLSPDGHQPMTVNCERCGSTGFHAPHERLWLIYNGELYNYKELRRELMKEGHVFHSQSDSEVLIHLYAEHGLSMLPLLNGIFALALYEGRPQARLQELRPGDLLLARDGLGVKPLYYTEVPKGFLFASEVKSILISPDVGRELDVVGLHYYIAYLWAPAPHTALREVKKMQPGEAVIVRKGRVKSRRLFYDLPYGQPEFQKSEKEIAEELQHHVAVAVRRQMVADVPVGAFLSGGLDSSAVVAMMQKASPGCRPTCYCIGFAGGESMDGNPSDVPYARRVAEHLDVDLRTILIEPDVILNLERLLYHLDEPQADPAPINVLLIAEQARREGYKVLLSGAGGDDIFSGYRRHLALKVEPYWQWLPQAMRRRLARQSRGGGHGSGFRGRLGGRPWFRRILKVLAHGDLPREDRLIAYFYWSEEELRRSLYSPALAEALRDVDTAEPLRQSLRRIPQERDPLNRMLYLEAKHFLADHNLNYTDKASMAAGVEVRVPLLDLDLVDFATRVPPGMKQKGREGKSIFKKAMEPFLPFEAVYRPKASFGAPLRRWLRHELKEMVEETLSADSLRRSQLFDPQAVQRLMQLDRTGKVDGAYTIFSLACIELWYRIFIDRPTQALTRGSS